MILFSSHKYMSPFHSSSQEMGAISKGNFKNFPSFDSSYNKAVFSTYDKLLDVENSHQINDVSDTSSTLASSHIFNSSQLNNKRKFDFLENFQFNQPIYDDFYDNKLEQIGCDFTDLIKENFP